MAYFTKGDLNQAKYRYSWTARAEGDNPRVIGSPDRDLLDRTEGYEVLDYINRAAVSNKWQADQGAAGRKLERLIHECPSNLRSHTNITNWITANWNN